MLANVLIIGIIICAAGIGYNLGYMRGTDILLKEVQEDIWELIVKEREEER